MVGYRVYLSPDDQERLKRLQEQLEFEGVVSVFRIAADRVMVRFPDEATVTKVFQKQCERANADLSSAPNSECRAVFLQLGVYQAYIHAMAEPLGFRSSGRMIRGLLLMMERGDI